MRQVTTADRYRKMLAKARGIFMHYADNHREKVGVKFPAGSSEAHDTLVKARKNDEIAAEIMSELEAPQLEVDYEFMVAKLQKDGDAILQKLTPIQAATVHMAMGVGGEAGELMDAVKRWAIYQKDLDRANVVEELGDLEFFMAGIRQNIGITREETLVGNMDKLGVRYKGHEYSDEQAIARRDKEPELALSDEDERLLELADQKHQAQMMDLEPACGDGVVGD